MTGQHEKLHIDAVKNWLLEEGFTLSGLCRYLLIVESFASF